jgi:calcineurin-like phosphoesterase family protein
MRNFVIADTHFNHTNIIKYCERPFADAEEMDETMIRNWNQVVSPNDTVYHLGDFAFGPGAKQMVEGYVRRLNGKIILVKGNHDHESATWYENRGFWSVHGGEATHYDGDKDVLLSHWPCPRKEPVINIYGHVHNLVKICSWNYRCVSVEQINYTPVDLDELIKEIRQHELRRV